MKTKSQIASSVFLCLFEILIGILLLIDPVGFTSGIIITTGVFFLVIGLRSIVKYFRTDAIEAARSQNLVKGLVALLAGGFCAFNSGWFVVTFPILTMIYGTVILLTGLGKVQIAVDMIRRKNKKWFLAAISAVVSVVCAVVILKSPFTSTSVLWMFTGITLIVESVFDIITIIAGGNNKDKADE